MFEELKDLMILMIFVAVVLVVFFVVVDVEENLSSAHRGYYTKF